MTDHEILFASVDLALSDARPLELTTALRLLIPVTGMNRLFILAAQNTKVCTLAAFRAWPSQLTRSREIQKYTQKQDSVIDGASALFDFLKWKVAWALCTQPVGMTTSQTQPDAAT